MVDGIAGADLLAALLTSTPTATLETAAPFAPRPVPSAWDLVRDAAGIVGIPLP